VIVIWLNKARYILSSEAKLYTQLTAVCSCLAMGAGDAGFAERLQGDVKRK